MRPSGSSIGNHYQMGGRHCEHVADDAVDVLVAKAVAIGNQRAVRATHGGGEVSEQFHIGVIRSLPVLGGIGVDHQLVSTGAVEARRLQIRRDITGAEGQPDAADVPIGLHPIHRAVQLGKAGYSLQVARFAANAWRVVVHVQIQPRRAKDRHEVAEEAVQQMQPGQFGPASISRS
jgi:hypothetical protein